MATSQLPQSEVAKKAMPIKQDCVKLKLRNND
jgi:hypothetical protein